MMLLLAVDEIVVGSQQPGALGRFLNAWWYHHDDFYHSYQMVIICYCSPDVC